jgi:hypothetical protein
VAGEEGAAARLAGLLREQARWCADLGSPLYAELLRRSAEDVESGGVARDVLRGHEEDPPQSFLALRLMGSVHRVVLEGAAPGLARHYPSAGGEPGDVWPVFRRTLEERHERIRALLSRPVQTNEVGRSAILVGAFLTVASETGLPLRCLEVGASAGLNLRWDRFRYESPGWAWGPPEARVRLTDVYGPGPTPPIPDLEVLERAGCDREPVDPTTEEGRLTLLSYVWPDQTERLDRLRGALDTAGEHPAEVDRAGAAQWVEERLAAPAPGAATVVYHSIVVMYFDAEERRRFTGAIEGAGERATHDAPLAWVSLEVAGAEFETRVRLWPGGEDRLLARSGPHGPPVRWMGG